ncbi:DUF6571 family protein [Cellulomonas fengjieae]|uniref:DUF6571 family protein n=1 Tax=Cellulomonas fengjieae TaxID=2819978 RepID=UPI001AAFC22C|nr:DUF6571 family protein [Cellulomonas fengjieae]MBO3102632.1 hypothetical protein [Cellulomonas fengjieae]
MVKVSIDVEAAQGVSKAFRTFYDDAMDEWTAVANAASSALVSTASLKALQDPLVLISLSANDLDSRVELAQLYNTGDSGHVPSGGVLTYELSGSSDSMESVKEQLGKELAENLQKIAPYGDYLDRDDVEAYDYYVGLLEKYEADPSVMTGMFEELGPEGVVQLPIMLKDFADQYQRDLGGKSDDDLFWDEDTPMSEHISEMQQKFIESLGTGFGNYTKTPGFDEDEYANGIVDAVKNRTGESFGLSQVLRYGEYDSAFLVNVGEGLYEFEKEEGGSGPIWGNQLNSEVANWQIGTDGDTKYYDPFIGLFEAMGRNPEASLDFLNPDSGGDDAQERAKYFIEERTWRADDFNALGLALDSASTAFHKAGDPNAERAAWVASATIKFLGERDGDPVIGDAGKDSLGHILATYVADIDAAAAGAEGGLGTHDAPRNSPWQATYPIGADFDFDALRKVMGEVLTDTGAASQLGAATAALNADRLNWAAENWGGEGTDTGYLQAAVNNGATLQGFILKTMGAGLSDEAKDADEQAQAFIDMASDVVGLVPTGGTFASFLSDQAKGAGQDWVSDKFTGNESRVDAEQHKVREVAWTDQQIALAIALAEAGKLPEGSMTNIDGVTHQWFDSGTFSADDLADPSVRDAFTLWLTGGSLGSTPTALIPDLAAMFDRGVERAG